MTIQLDHAIWRKVRGNYKLLSEVYNASESEAREMVRKARKANPDLYPLQRTNAVPQHLMTEALGSPRSVREIILFFAEHNYFFGPRTIQKLRKAWVTEGQK